MPEIKICPVEFRQVFVLTYAVIIVPVRNRALQQIHLRTTSLYSNDERFPKRSYTTRSGNVSDTCQRIFRIFPTKIAPNLHNENGACFWKMTTASPANKQSLYTGESTVGKRTSRTRCEDDESYCLTEEQSLKKQKQVSLVCCCKCLLTTL